MSELKVLTVKEVAELLRLHPQTVVKLLKEKKLQGALIGREWRVSEEAVRDYLRGSPKADALALREAAMNIPA